jgi:hypothetical protein
LLISRGIRFDALGWREKENRLAASCAIAGSPGKLRILVKASYST